MQVYVVVEETSDNPTPFTHSECYTNIDRAKRHLAARAKEFGDMHTTSKSDIMIEIEDGVECTVNDANDDCVWMNISITECTVVVDGPL